MARASAAGGPGGCEATMARTWKAISPTSIASPTAKRPQPRAMGGLAAAGSKASSTRRLTRLRPTPSGRSIGAESASDGCRRTGPECRSWRKARGGMPTSAHSAHGSSDALDAAAPIIPAALVCTSSSAKYTDVRGTNRRQHGPRHPFVSRDVQQRSTATVPPLDTARTGQMRIDDRRPNLLAGDAAPLQAGGSRVRVPLAPQCDVSGQR